MTDQIKDVVIPILQILQADISAMKADILGTKTDIEGLKLNVEVLRKDVAVLKENTRRIDMRLSAVESHMSGFMSTVRYLEAEANEMRGRVEYLEHLKDNR